MSARGFLSAGSRSRPKILAESKRYLPLSWLSFLTLRDVEAAECAGRFELDRKWAIEASSGSLPFLASTFAIVPAFADLANSLVEKVKAQKSKTIRIEIEELVGPDGDDPPPNLGTAVAAIEARDAAFSLTVPARTIVNPFTKEDLKVEAKRYDSTREMLLSVCSLTAEDLTSGSQGSAREAILGYVWD